MTNLELLEWRLEGIRRVAFLVGWTERSYKAARKLSARIERVKAK